MPADFRPLVIAIDGPSGAGKGTVARALATQLRYRHIDTGAMYRAVAWKASLDGLALDDETRVATLAEHCDLELSPDRVAIDGHDVTRAIRTPAMDQAAARVARLARVRDVLVSRQRALGEGGGVVMEGRDIGSVVFPDADLKIYLDASAETRAQRRAGDLAHTGQQGNLTGVQQQLQARDRSDSERAVAPLTLAEGAIYLDTTHLAPGEVVARVLEEVWRVQNEERRTKN